MCKTVEKPCGCRVKVNDFGGYESISEFVRRCRTVEGLVSQLAEVRGKRFVAAKLADAITHHVLFA